MTDKKFTDEEIIKALREMADYPHNYEEGQQLKNALDLINRQRAEIKRLRKEVNLVSIQFQDLQERTEGNQSRSIQRVCGKVEKEM